MRAAKNIAAAVIGVALAAVAVYLIKNGMLAASGR